MSQENADLSASGAREAQPALRSEKLSSSDCERIGAALAARLVFKDMPGAHFYFSATKYRRLENRLGHARPSHASGQLAPRSRDRTARGER